jgi:hypothetical protein
MKVGSALVSAMFCLALLIVLKLRDIHVKCTVKAKLSRYGPEQAYGRSGRLRPRIFLTFGTRRW